MKYNKIMLAGPSGYGKTTLAKWLSENTGIEFVSGSVSDLIPSTKEITHRGMLDRDPSVLYKEDYQIINLRNKLFRDKEAFISDRSYLDSASYFIFKQANNQPQCEIEQFVNYCGMLLSQQCECLIFLNFVPGLLKDWLTEDNHQRIVNNYFQIEISSIMYTTLNLLGYRGNFYTKLDKSDTLLNRLFYPEVTELEWGFEIGSIDTLYGHTDVFIINEPNLDLRKNILKRYIL